MEKKSRENKEEMKKGKEKNMKAALELSRETRERIKERTVSINSLAKALYRGLNTINGGALASEKDAGTVTAADGTKCTKCQVFVKVARLDEELLEEKPDTGGLLENDREDDE